MRKIIRGTRQRLWPWMLLLAVSPPVRADDGLYDVKLSVYDRLGRPGEVVTLSAKLEHQGFAGINPDMHGYPLHFTGPGVLARKVRTGREGIAGVEVRLPDASAGPGRVRVDFPGSRQHRPRQQVGRLFVWPEDSRILIIDIDHTISDLRQRDVVFTENEHIPALPGAVEALTELARTYRILYLTARDEALFTKTRDWLQARGFPEGPLFTRDYHLWEGRGPFKSHFLADLKRRYPNVTTGVSDTADDARAYLENGMTCFLIAPGGAGRVPGATIVVASWRAVCEALTPEGARHRVR